MKPDQTLANLIGVKYEYYSPVDDKDKNNHQCGVRALCKISGESYKKVYKKLLKQAAKRYDYHNTFNVLVEVAKKKYGCEDFRVNSNISVATFCGYHKKGKYLVFVNGHAFPYIDGCIYDCDENGEEDSKSDLESLLTCDVIHVLVKNKEKNDDYTEN